MRFLEDGPKAGGVAGVVVGLVELACTLPVHTLPPDQVLPALGQPAIDALAAYDSFLGEPDRQAVYWQTLKDRPWRGCASTSWRLDLACINSGASEHPRNDRVRVPHFTRLHFVASPHEDWHLRNNF